MPIATEHGLQLKHPTELAKFEHAGVRFVRETAEWQSAVYTATDRAGRTYTVTTGGTKRYPWRVVDATGNVDRAKTLLGAAEWIAKLERVPVI